MVDLLSLNLLQISPSLLEWENAHRILDVKLINFRDFQSLLLRLIIDVVFAVAIIRGIYAKNNPIVEYKFTFLLFNILLFFIIYILSNVRVNMEEQMGFAFGLFAILAILRYRTQQIPIREMTYLFIAISIALINGYSSKKISYAEFIFANMLVVGVTYTLERVWLSNRAEKVSITYEKIKLITPDKREELTSDLKARTGLDIVRVDVGKIDFLRDTTNLTVYYRPTQSKNVPKVK